jgi:hypothetical protein
MRHLFAFLILAAVKTAAGLLFPCRHRWLTAPPADPWTGDIRLFVFLNHTSLYEPVFVQILPYRYLWQLSAHANVPAADVTLNRPLVGRFWKLMIPNIAGVTRRNDGSWETYLASIKNDEVVLIAPEGRMKRPNGLDKYGRPMTVRGGVADIIQRLDSGAMVLCLSGGLHHVQAPGEHVPKVFRRITANLAYLDLKSYRAGLPGDFREQKLAIVQDLQRRLERDCPPQNV